MEETGRGSAAEAAEMRLRRYVSGLLDLARIDHAQRFELDEELRSGLWERWRAEMDAGLAPDAAADAAIAAFGSPVALANELALATHSRLWAATIGALLPVVNEPPSLPPGLRRTQLLLVLIGLLDVVAILAAFASLSPLRAAVATIGLVAAAATWFLAARAIGQGQRWALALARLGVVVATTVTSLNVAVSGFSVNLLAVVAIAAALPVFGGDLSTWVAASRGVGWRLGIGIVAICLAPAATALAAVLPDPLAITAADMGLAVTVTCEGTADAPTSLVVDADATLLRAELWPSGFGQSNASLDRVAVWLEGTPGVPSVGAEIVRSDHRYFQPPWWSLVRFVDSSAGEQGTVDPSTALWPGLTDELVDVRPGQPATSHWVADNFGFAPVAMHLDRVVVTWAHGTTAGLQAVSGCGQPSIGVPLAPPFALP